MNKQNKIEEINHNDDTLDVYFYDIARPLIVDKEDLFQWLYENDLLSWSEHPSYPEQVDTVKSGTFTMEQYFEQSSLVIEADVEKYLNATVF